MSKLGRALLAAESGVAAGWRWLAQPLAFRLACWMGPVAAGILSMWLGQDSNWDLRNYHLYNAHALLNGKVGYDLAPAQFQSYFNPTLDLLYYGLSKYLPTRGSTFIMGYLHGLNYVLLIMIGRQLLGAAAGTRLPLLLALAGCLGFGFLTTLGNTMGDNMTSLCVLGALLLLLRHWPLLRTRGVRGTAIVLLSGAVIGIGTGLKLTNANYALALCLALFALPIGFWARLRSAFVFALGVLGGICLSAGYWYWTMWQLFGNPLFPQFNNKFLGPLAAPIGVADSGWLPKSFFEAVFWPFLFTFNPRRVIELPMNQIIWPMVYVAFLTVVVTSLRRMVLGRPSPLPPQAPGAAMLLSFFGISYLIWLNLFGIYRYLVPLELLAPLVLWLLVHRLARAPLARQVSAWCLTLAVLVIFPLSNWGHSGHAAKSFDIDMPHFAEPEQNMVLTVLGDPPMGWIATALPPKLAVVALGSGFPESAAYGERMLAMMAARRGPFYMMVTGNGLTPGPQAAPEPVVANSGKDEGKPYMQATANGFALVRQSNAAVSANQIVLDAGKEVLSRYGLGLREGSCIAYLARIGQNAEVFQLCEVIPPAKVSAAVH